MDFAYELGRQWGRRSVKEAKLRGLYTGARAGLMQSGRLGRWAARLLPRVSAATRRASRTLPQASGLTENARAFAQGVGSRWTGAKPTLGGRWLQRGSFVGDVAARHPYAAIGMLGSGPSFFTGLPISKEQREAFLTAFSPNSGLNWKQRPLALLSSGFYSPPVPGLGLLNERQENLAFGLHSLGSRGPFNRALGLGLTGTALLHPGEKEQTSGPAAYDPEGYEADVQRVLALLGDGTGGAEGQLPDRYTQAVGPEEAARASNRFWREWMQQQLNGRRSGGR